MRVHCKKQNERKCEICLQAFCKRSTLKAHQEQGCERVLESPDQPNVEDSKPTFVDCISEPAPCLEQDINLDASFVCEIIPKEAENTENENESGDDIEQSEVAIDSSNHATASADNDCMPLGRRRRRVKNRTKTTPKAKAKKTRKGKHRKRNRLYEFDDVDESSGTIYYCYLCKRR